MQYIPVTLWKLDLYKQECAMSWLKEKLRKIFPGKPGAGSSPADGLVAMRRLDEVRALLDYESLVSQLPATVRPHNFLARRLATQSTVQGEQSVDAFEDAYSFTGPHTEELVSRFGLDPLRIVDAANAVSAIGRRSLREQNAEVPDRKLVEREISLHADLEADQLYIGKHEAGKTASALYDWLAAAAPYAPELFDDFSASTTAQGDLALTYTGKPRDWSAVTASPLDRPGQGPRRP
jgi:hypothetical protein